MELGQPVKMFRCQIDPMIGGFPRNAFKPKDLGMEARLLLPVGIWVKTPKTRNHDGGEHIVPFANIQSIELEVSQVVEIKPAKAKRSEAV